MVAQAALAAFVLALDPAPSAPPVRSPVTDAVVEPSGLLSLTLTVNPANGVAPLNVTFAVSVTGGIAPYSYSWTFGDGTGNTGGAVVWHVFQNPGTYTVEVQVSDLHGDSGVASTNLPIGASPTTPPAIEYLLVGAVLAAVFGIVVGVYLSRRGGGTEDDSEGSDPYLPSADYIPPGSYPTPAYQVIPRWVSNPVPPSAPGAPLPYQAPPSGYEAFVGRANEPPPPTYAHAPAPAPFGPPPARTTTGAPSYAPRAPEFHRPSYVPRAAPTPPSTAPPPGAQPPETYHPVRIGSKPAWTPAQVPYAPTAPAPPVRPPAPRAATPSPVVPRTVAPLAPPPQQAPPVPPPPPPPAPPPSPPLPPLAGPLLGLRPDDGTPPLEFAARLNALPWKQIEDEAAHAPTPQLVRLLNRLDPLARLARRLEQDPNRVRLLLRDFFRAWLDGTRTPPAAGAPAPVRRFASLFGTSSGSDTPSLRARLGEVESSLTWRAVVRTAPVLVFVLVAFVAVEAATFVALYATYAHLTPTPVESLVVPFAVLGPPALILIAFPVLEWGLHLWRRARAHDTSDRLFALPQIRVLSYLLVLGLAETSRVIADLASSGLFHTPSSILQGGGVSSVGVLGFLAVLLATGFFAWAAISAWNVGGSQRATLAASLLYLSVLAIWVGTEARLLLYLAQSPTWATVAGAQKLLLDVPVYLLIACFFVVMVFVAFTEPQLQEEHQAPTRLRLSVAQALVDDMEARPLGGPGVPMDRLSDLARGEAGPRVAKALRELLSFDPDSGRYLVLRALDSAQETVVYLHTRSDPGGSFYVLETASQASGAAGADASPASAGLFSAPAAGSAASPDALWSRADLESPAAWLPLLRQQKTSGGRLSRPSSDARSGAAYKALSMLLMDPSADEARELFRRVGWTKPSGTMLLARLIQSGKNGEAMAPDIETDGEYLEVELNRFSGHAEDASPYIGPWSIGSWKITREVQTGSSGGIQYRAVLAPGAAPATTTATASSAADPPA